MSSTDKPINIYTYFRAFPITHLSDDPKINKEKQKDRYDAINALIINAFHDVIYDDKVSTLIRSYLDDVLHPVLHSFCLETFDLADKYHKEAGETFKQNFFNFCKFYANSSNGKKVSEKAFDGKVILDFPKVLKLLAEEDFDFKNSKFLEGLLNYASSK